MEVCLIYCFFVINSNIFVGTMSYLTAFGKSVLVLHTAEVIKDLLDKRAKIYSHRPHTVMGGEIYGLDNVGVYTYLQDYIRDLCSFLT